MSYFPDRKTFVEKAARGNLVPVWKELVADQETPVSAYARLRTALRARGGKAYTFLLESVEGGEHIGRYSFLGGDPRVIFRARGRSVEIVHTGGETKHLRDVDPLNELKALMAQYKPVPDPALPRFFGGAVGYLGYDAICQFEPRVPLSKGADHGMPDMEYAITDTILIFDRVRHTVKVVVNATIDGNAEKAYGDAVKRIDELCAHLSQPVPNVLMDAHEKAAPLEAKSNMTREEFVAAVLKGKEYIKAGDIIQVVLSQRFQVDYDGDPLDLYRAIRSLNPSPYQYCLEFGELSVVGSSPEVHVRCEDGLAEVRPIAGTRPRGADVARDNQLAEELLADPKERAEHIMLVDLGRNDLGRVCTYGSVRVPELMVIERYSHVMHIVSDVTGTLSSEYDAYDLMRATFPAGTVSGAPKIRAMEIIAELEKDRRGLYSGTVGYFSFTGNLDSCITIRTAILDGKRAYVQAGAGIVADSNPDSEYEETRNKARGMLTALALAPAFAKARKGGSPS